VLRQLLASPSSPEPVGPTEPSGRPVVLQQPVPSSPHRDLMPRSPSGSWKRRAEHCASMCVGVLSSLSTRSPSRSDVTQLNDILHPSTMFLSQLRCGRAVATAILVGAIAYAGERVDAQVPGTYRLTICTARCSPSDSGVVRGVVVLFAAPTRLDTIAPPLRDSLALGSLFLLWRSTANACFSLPTGPPRVDGRELYAGITRRGFTHWSRAGRKIVVSLYQSPDASYTLVGTVSGSVYSGQGEQGNCCGGESPTTYFRAVRAGDADLAACL